MSEFWILVAINVVGFILTWIICSKPASESDWKSLEPSPPVMMINPYDAEKESLRRQVYVLERELHYRKYERPVEVNIENIIKVDNEKVN